MTSLKLSDLCNIRYGKDHKELAGGPYPVYGSGGIMRYVEKPISQGPSVLIPRKGTLGNLFYTDGPFWTVDTLFWTEIDDKKIIPKYLYYLLKTEDLAGLNIGTAVPSLSTDVLNEIQLSIPEMGTQKKAVALLDSIESKININNQINDYLTELLLVLQKQTEDTEYLVESRADTLFNIHIGKTPPRKESEWFSFNRVGNVIWMSIKDMGNGDTYLIDSSEYLTPEAIEKHNVKKCSPGSILLSFKLTVGRVGIAANEMVTNEAIACFSSDDSRKLAYLYPLLKSYDYASLGSTSSIATAVNSKMIKSMIIKMPSSPALDRYYKQAEPIYGFLLDNAKEAVALTELRDALLPKLMSGEIDVSKVNITQLNNHLSDR